MNGSTSSLVAALTTSDDGQRNRALDDLVAQLGPSALLAECAALNGFRKTTHNLYERVRALFFLHAIHRFHLSATGRQGHIPFEGYRLLLDRRFEEAIARFEKEQEQRGQNDALSSALAAAYKGLGFQTLADQVRRSVRSVRGNSWMFRCGHPLDQPLRIRPELCKRGQAAFPALRERTPVRMDLTHSGWSDIFFLGMDHPEGAKVLNVSIDLAVRGRDRSPAPPIETWLRVIDEPILRLSSVDLGASADVTELATLFDFARDHLGLLKAAVLAAGIVPPGIEGSGATLKDLLSTLVGPGLGLEIVSRVSGIPKGSRLAVSTSLLGSLISLCMRATSQTRNLTGMLDEGERRTCAARAILGEWLGGSGGGWQDSGGLWPGIKLIEGVPAAEGDPEFGASRGRLLPRHTILNDAAAPESTRRALMDSLVLVHGGMAQNVGPILEMVTERYLLRDAGAWTARKETLSILRELLSALRVGDIAALARATTCNFQGPLQAIIPQASNAFTETVIDRVRARFASDFLGFWMLGGMSGGGMGFIFEPKRQQAAKAAMQEILTQAKRELQDALPFAMEPVVYDFAINDFGTHAELLDGERVLLPADYYTLTVPALLRSDPRTLSPLRRSELDRLGEACRTDSELAHVVRGLFDRLLPRTLSTPQDETSLALLLREHGFDREMHEEIRRDLGAGRIGLAQNRLPASSRIEDVEPGDVLDARAGAPSEAVAKGRAALTRGEVAVVSLAAGAASRWTGGAGVVKALSPFAKLGGRFRSFLDVHVGKSRRTARESGTALPHILTTSYFTHSALERRLSSHEDGDVPLFLSPGRAVGLRLVPMERDLRFLWEETSHQRLDIQQQKVRESLHSALIEWARQHGQGSDYTDNLAAQCLHPVGHWYEIPNLLRNGVLARLLRLRPQLTTLMLHNIDTLGAYVDAGLLGLHLRERERGATLTFEVIARQVDDRGGGLARVDGKVRLVEGLALPREETEFALSYYNTMTTWIDIDGLLALFGLARGDLREGATAAAKIADAVRKVASRLPTYITLKDVKKRWGHGQEDVFPVTQFEKLWSDMSAMPGVDARYLLVERKRGQQLKEPAQLDGWLRDGSASYVEKLCTW